MTTNNYLMNRIVKTKCNSKCEVCGKEIEVNEETVSKKRRYSETKFYHKECYDKLFV